VARLATIDAPFDGYRRKLDLAISEGRVAARRQVRSLIGQAEALASESSAFAALASRARDAGADPPGLDAAVDHARSVVGEFAGYLRDSYLPHAPEHDGVGDERYRRSVEPMVGMPVDPHEAYAWGWDELADLRAEMSDVASEIRPGAGIEE